MNLIAKVLATIGTFFMGILQPYSLPSPSPTPSATIYPTLPSATPTYQTQIYINPTLNYQFAYPANTTVTTNEGIAHIEKVTLFTNPDSFTQELTPEYLLKHDLWCDADGPTGPGIHCTNTAVRPFTNTASTSGYLVKRKKDIGTEVQDDVAYVFPRPNHPQEGIILRVDEVTPSHLEVLDTIASSFSWK